MNYDFFKNSVYIKEKDVFLHTHSFRDFYRNATLNSLYWEKLSWLRTRSHQKPCKDGVLRDFCPPASGIEVAMQKNDLCHKSK